MGSMGKCWRRCGGCEEVWKLSVGKVSGECGGWCRVGLPHFHCTKGGQVSLKVNTSADVQFFTQNQVKSNKRPSRLQMSNFSPKIKWRANKKQKKKEGHHAPGRCLKCIFPKFLCRHDFTCFHCSKYRKGGHLGIFWRPRRTNYFLFKRRTYGKPSVEVGAGKVWESVGRCEVSVERRVRWVWEVWGRDVGWVWRVWGEVLGRCRRVCGLPHTFIHTSPHLLSSQHTFPHNLHTHPIHFSTPPPHPNTLPHSSPTLPPPSTFPPYLTPTP